MDTMALPFFSITRYNASRCRRLLETLALSFNPVVLSGEDASFQIRGFSGTILLSMQKMCFWLAYVLAESQGNPHVDW